MEQSKAMEYESRKASSDVLKPRNTYILNALVSHVRESDINPLAYTDVPETAGLARSINTQPAVKRNSETNPTSQHDRGMY